MTNFKELTQALKAENIDFDTVGEWRITLPYDTHRDTIHKLLLVCRKSLNVNWHIIYPEPSASVAKPEIVVYWDRIP